MICDCFLILIYTDWPCALSSPRLDKFAHYKSPLSLLSLLLFCEEIHRSSFDSSHKGLVLRITWHHNCITPQYVPYRLIRENSRLCWYVWGPSMSWFRNNNANESDEMFPKSWHISHISVAIYQMPTIHLNVITVETILVFWIVFVFIVVIFIRYRLSDAQIKSATLPYPSKSVTNISKFRSYRWTTLLRSFQSLFWFDQFPCKNMVSNLIAYIIRHRS